jgi:hypothetical protein
VDITQLILDDHHEQRRLFSILEQIDPADTRSLTQVWRRLSTFLEVHAQAEESIFYPELLRLAVGPRHLVSAEPETLDAIHDHNDIRDAITAVAPHAISSPEWLAAVAGVNVANGDHMAEEEREGLTDFRRSVALQRRHELAVAFAVFEAQHFAGVRPVDKDPAEYVAEAELAAEADGGAEWADGAAVPLAHPGSLGIGSLR